MAAQTAQSEVKLTVSVFSNSKIKVSPDRGVALMDEEPTIRWVPTGGLTIEYIGFADPVGPGQDIEIPADDGTGAWTAKNYNGSKALYNYTIYAKQSNGVVISSDPQIENEGKSGVVGGAGGAGGS